ncbi:MAG: PEP-utilizing enzyme [Parasphingorhabdus sp.]|uniref:PEP-utilizing enzyme n=1 Tax=Parasphingorhabdus sp. TaxID=2709688 RepID=UPI0032980A57
MKLNDLLNDWSKVDDIAVKALSLSLTNSVGEVVMQRLRNDYLQDVGIIGLLRQTYVEHSLEATAKQFWESRREANSPRVESLIAQLLLNITASGIFEVLKELYQDPQQLKLFLSDRNIAAISLYNTRFDVALAWRDLKMLFQLHKLKSGHNAETVKTVISEVLSGHKIRIEIEGDVENDINSLQKNLQYALRGLVFNEIEKSGEVILPANGRSLRGRPGSHGIGWGGPVMWPAAELARPTGEYVLVVSDFQGALPDNFMHIMSTAQAVVSDGGMTGHIAVFCRGIGVPLVLVNSRKLTSICKHGFVAIDGTIGIIKLFLTRAASGR